MASLMSYISALRARATIADTPARWFGAGLPLTHLSDVASRLEDAILNPATPTRFACAVPPHHGVEDLVLHTLDWAAAHHPMVRIAVWGSLPPDRVDLLYRANRSEGRRAPIMPLGAPAPIPAVDIGIIVDPYATIEAGTSADGRAAVQAAFVETINKHAPLGAVIVTHSRFDAADLIGSLPEPAWTKVNLAATSESGPLWAEAWTSDTLEHRASLLGTSLWQKLYLGQVA